MCLSKLLSIHGRLLVVLFFCKLPRAGVEPGYLGWILACNPQDTLTLQNSFANFFTWLSSEINHVRHSYILAENHFLYLFLYYIIFLWQPGVRTPEPLISRQILWPLGHGDSRDIYFHNFQWSNFLIKLNFFTFVKINLND